MKNSTYAYTYTVELSISHPTRELSYLAKEMASIPIGSVGKGRDLEDAIKNKLPYEDIKTTKLGYGSITSGKAPFYSMIFPLKLRKL